jgi:hypothetical protein
LIFLNTACWRWSFMAHLQWVFGKPLKTAWNEPICQKLEWNGFFWGQSALCNNDISASNHSFLLSDPFWSILGGSNKIIIQDAALWMVSVSRHRPHAWSPVS